MIFRSFFLGWITSLLIHCSSTSATPTNPLPSKDASQASGYSGTQSRLDQDSRPPIPKPSGVGKDSSPTYFEPKPWATSPKSPPLSENPKSPYEVRVNPHTHQGPMAIDTSHFATGTKSLHGGIRNARLFWKAWLKEFPETLSPENQERIHNSRSPHIDEVWIKHFPEHAAYLGETIIHHHLDYGPYAVALPQSVHAKPPGWGIWHYEHAGHRHDSEPNHEQE